MNKVRIIFFALLIFLGGAVTTTTYAQVKPDPVLQACEETADKAKRLEIENASLKAQLDIANQRVTLEKERTANKEEQLQFYKKASEKGDQIDHNNELIVLNLRQQVADDRLRINDLERENKSLRSSRDFRTVVGFGAGFATGWLTKK